MHLESRQEEVFVRRALAQNILDETILLFIFMAEKRAFARQNFLRVCANLAHLLLMTFYATQNKKRFFAQVDEFCRLRVRARARVLCRSNSSSSRLFSRRPPPSTTPIVLAAAMATATYVRGVATMLTTTERRARAFATAIKNGADSRRRRDTKLKKTLSAVAFFGSPASCRGGVFSAAATPTTTTTTTSARARVCARHIEMLAAALFGSQAF